jgi:hypothetical protein
MESATTNMGLLARNSILSSIETLFIARPGTWGGEKHSDIDEALVVELACAPAR